LSLLLGAVEPVSKAGAVETRAEELEAAVASSSQDDASLLRAFQKRVVNVYFFYGVHFRVQKA
jgi:hypothetical protein